jgi:hypothetical protein
MARPSKKGALGVSRAFAFGSAGVLRGAAPPAAP